MSSKMGFGAFYRDFACLSHLCDKLVQLVAVMRQALQGLSACRSYATSLPRASPACRSYATSNFGGLLQLFSESFQLQTCSKCHP